MDLDIDRRSIRRYALGDVAAIVLFVALGEFSHGVNPLTVLPAFLETLLTFLVGWFAVTAPAGVYGTQSLSDARYAIIVPVLAWAVADAIAQLLRSTAYVSGNAALSFYLVALVVGGALIGGWRYVAYRNANG